MRGHGSKGGGSDQLSRRRGIGWLGGVVVFFFLFSFSLFFFPVVKPCVSIGVCVETPRSRQGEVCSTAVDDGAAPRVTGSAQLSLSGGQEGGMDNWGLRELPEQRMRGSSNSYHLQCARQLGGVLWNVCTTGLHARTVGTYNGLYKCPLTALVNPCVLCLATLIGNAQ